MFFTKVGYHRSGLTKLLLTVRATEEST